MKVAHAICLAFAVAMLSSCVTYGNKTLDDPRKYLNIREGESTKQDVYQVFGQPQDVDYSDDQSRSMWTYFKVETSPNAWSYVPYIGIIAGGTNEEITKVYFFFDTDQRLIRTETNNKSDSENSWVGMARVMSKGKRDDRAERVSAEMGKIGKPFDKKAAHKVKFVR
jgi:hypothetical protein